jgi:hypothetical protein
MSRFLDTLFPTNNNNNNNDSDSDMSDTASVPCSDTTDLAKFDEMSFTGYVSDNADNGYPSDNEDTGYVSADKDTDYPVDDDDTGYVSDMSYDRDYEDFLEDRGTEPALLQPPSNVDGALLDTNEQEDCDAIYVGDNIDIDRTNDEDRLGLLAEDECIDDIYGSRLPTHYVTPLPPVTNILYTTQLMLKSDGRIDYLRTADDIARVHLSPRQPTKNNMSRCLTVFRKLAQSNNRVITRSNVITMYELIYNKHKVLARNIPVATFMQDLMLPNKVGAHKDWKQFIDDHCMAALPHTN